MNLTPLQHDALLESFNIAVARAAVSLSRLLREEVQLSVPTLDLISVEDATLQLCELFHEQVSVVTQSFEGEINSRALLIIPSSNTLQIVRLAVGELVTDADLPELEEEAISELGNILLNAFTATLANQLKLDLYAPPPNFMHADPLHILSEPQVVGYELVLMTHISMTIYQYQIRSRLAFLLDAHSSGILAAALTELIARYENPILMTTFITQTGV
jgi:chemotaxis protein CheC